MSDVKYEYLYNDFDELVHTFDGIRGNSYKLYKNSNLDYIYKEGEQRAYFAKKIEISNPFASIGVNNNLGESPEHYNAKMKIVKEKKYFDTVFNQWIEFDNVIEEEFQIGNKKPDLSCYDSNGNLIMCIEIFYTSKKSLFDIEQLKKIEVPITEINIKNDNRCEHVILPKVLELNKQEYEKLFSKNREIKRIESHQTNFGTNTNRGVEQKINFVECEINRLTDSKSIGYKDYTDSKINQIKYEIESRIEQTEKIIKDLREYSHRRKGNVIIPELESEIKRTETRIIEVKELIEINAFYSNPQTNDFLWIN